MAGSTSNYGLSIMDDNEYADQYVINENMKKIDTAIFEAGNNEELEGNVAGLVEKIGNTTDVGGSDTTGSVMGKLNKSLSDISSIADTIGTSDVGNTMFDKLNQTGVRNIQRGTFSFKTTTTSEQFKINLSGFVNPARMFVILEGGACAPSNAQSRFMVASITAKELTIQHTAIAPGTANEYRGSYFVIECY